MYNNNGPYIPGVYIGFRGRCGRGTTSCVPVPVTLVDPLYEGTEHHYYVYYSSWWSDPGITCKMHGDT